MLVGGNGTWAVLSREAMLASRVYRRGRFQPLTRPDVLGALLAYDPIYENEVNRVWWMQTPDPP